MVSHLLSSGPAPSPREVMDTYRRAFSQRVLSGSLRPVVVPYHLYSFLLLVAYLCIPHTKRPLVYAARWVVLGVIINFQLLTLRQTSSQNMAIAYVAGIISVWGIFWSATWLVWYRPQFDAKRVERRIIMKSLGEETKENGQRIVRDQVQLSNLRERVQANGKASTDGFERQIELPRTNGVTNNGDAGVPKEEIGKIQETEYYWQPYPDKLLERIDWVFDLTMNFRGPGWNWAIPPLPGLPPSVKPSQEEFVSAFTSHDISNERLKGFSSRQQIFRTRVPQFVAGYFALDALKTTMMRDPYFIVGPNTYDLPPHLSDLSPLKLQIYRKLVIFAALVTSLEMGFLLAPIVMCLILGPAVLGLRGEAWQYPTSWGPLSAIFTRGLNGLWGGWWHQTFRFAFSAPTNFLITNGNIEPRSRTTKLLTLLIAFGISAAMHSGGSVAQFPDTTPWHTMTFFILQAVGIFLQVVFCSTFQPYLDRIPQPVRQAGNAAFTVLWLFYTSDWLVDDVARGGIWLYEPIPISVFRGLGFGNDGEGWWCWEHIGVSWYGGNYWWDSGIAF